MLPYERVLYVVLHYITLFCYVMCVMLPPLHKLLYIMFCYVMQLRNFFTPIGVIYLLHYITLWEFCYAMPHFVTLCYVQLFCYITLYYIKSTVTETVTVIILQ